MKPDFKALTNVCAVRTLLSGFGNDGAKAVLQQTPLPHEPQLDGARFVWPVDPGFCHQRLRVCKHCGALYLKDGSE